MIRLAKDADTGCCPKFDASKWDHQVVVWTNKRFLKAHVRCFFRYPLDFKDVIKTAIKTIKEHNAQPVDELVLTDKGGLFSRDVFIAVKKDVPHHEIVDLSGTYIARVFEGEHFEFWNWVRKMKEHVSVKGVDLEKLYFYYPYCHRCSKHYGKNFVVALAKVN